MESLPLDLRLNFLRASLNTELDVEAVKKAALDISDYIAHQLEIIMGTDMTSSDTEHVMERLEQFRLSISRILLICDTGASLNLNAALLSVYLDVLCCQRACSPNGLRPSVIESFCTICFSTLKGSVEHVLDVLLQAECIHLPDWVLIHPILRKLKASKGMASPSLAVFTKMIITGRSMTAIFGNQGHAAVESIIRDAATPHGLSEFLVENGYTSSDLTPGHLMADGTLTDDQSERIIDGLMGLAAETGGVTMETLEAAGNVDAAADLLVRIDNLPSFQDPDHEESDEDEEQSPKKSDDNLSTDAQSPENLGPEMEDEEDAEPGDEDPIQEIITNTPLLTVRIEKFDTSIVMEEPKKAEKAPKPKTQKTPKKRPSAASLVGRRVTRSVSRKPREAPKPKSPKAKDGKRTKSRKKKEVSPTTATTDPTPPLKMRLRHRKLNVEEEDPKVKRTRTLPSNDGGRRPTRSQTSKARTKP